MKFDDLVSVVIFLAIIFLAYIAGTTKTEAEHCRKNGGKYSYDFMECVK